MAVEAPSRSPAPRTIGAMPPGLARWAAEIGAAAGAIVIAAAVTAWAARRVPTALSVHTSVVGYPTQFGFDIERWIALYLLVVILLPLLAVTVYIGAIGLASRAHLTRLRARPPETARDPQFHAETSAVAAVARLGVAGCVLGLELAVVVGRPGRMTALITLAAGSAYVVTAVAVSRLRRISTGTVNAFAGPVVIALLSAVSAVTAVTVRSSGAIHHYAWCPPWVALPLAAVTALWVARRVVFTAQASTVREAERLSLLWLTVPVGIFVATATVTGPLPGMDMFAQSEPLVGAQLGMQGAVYWRDLLTVHGFFEDVAAGAVGMWAFGHSAWGSAAGRDLLLTPLTCVFLYFFGAKYLSRSWGFLAAFVVAIVSGSIVVGAPMHRFLLWPVLLVLLGWVLERPDWWRSALLGALLAGWTVIVPETAFLVLPIAAVLIGFELVHRQGKTPVRVLTRSIGCAGGGIAVLAALFPVLAWYHALQGFFFYFLVFAQGHELEGAIPLFLNPGWLQPAMAAAPIVAWLAAVPYFVARARLSRLTVADWVLAASGGVAILYYLKLIDRADWPHVYQVFFVTVPLIAYIMHAACNGVDLALISLLRGWWGRLVRDLKPAGVVVLAASVLQFPLLGPQSLLHHVDKIPARYRMVADREPRLPALGYSTASALDWSALDDTKAVLDTYLQPGDWAFDFTNSPGWYYFLIPRSPDARYFEVAAVLVQASQADLISQFEKHPPKLIAVDSKTTGFPQWDGIPNMVRHYDVSQYIFDHYRPLLAVGGQTFYIRIGSQVPDPRTMNSQLSNPVVTNGLPFQVMPCDWGDTPNFLSVAATTPHPGVTPVQLTAEEIGPAVTFNGVAADRRGEQVKEIVALVDGKVVSEASVSEQPPDSSQQLIETLASPPSGFHLQVMGYNPGRVEVFAIGLGGSAVELWGGQRPLQQAQITLPDGTTASVRPGPVHGKITSVLQGGSVARLTLPPGATWSQYRWLQIQAPGGLAADRWWLSDQPAGNGDRQILFNSMPRAGATYRVQAGSCAQWHAYESPVLYLAHAGPERPFTVTLLP